MENEVEVKGVRSLEEIEADSILSESVCVSRKCQYQFKGGDESRNVQVDHSFFDSLALHSVS